MLQPLSLQGEADRRGVVSGRLFRQVSTYSTGGLSCHTSLHQILPSLHNSEPLLPVCRHQYRVLTQGMAEMNLESLHSEEITCIPLRVFIFQAGPFWRKCFRDPWFSALKHWQTLGLLLSISLIDHICKVHCGDRYCFTSISSSQEL